MDRPSPFTFGTARSDDPDDPRGVELVRRAVERGAWLHGAASYGRSLEVIASVGATGLRPRMIAKSRTRTPQDLRAELDQTRTRAGLERLDAVQICARPDPAILAPGHPFRAALEEQRHDGLVGGYLLELFWPFCDALRPALEDDLFDGAVFYYSAFNREVDPATLETLKAGGKWIAALRPFCGGRLGDGPKAHLERGKKIERDGAHDAKFAALEGVAAEFGVPSLRELSLRFVRSIPEVATVVGSTRRSSHLEESLDDAENLEPLLPAATQRIHALHAEWWGDAGAGYQTNLSTDLPVPPAAPPAPKGGFGSKLRRLFGG